MLGLSDVTRTSRVRSLTARELPLAVQGYLVYCTSAKSYYLDDESDNDGSDSGSSDTCYFPLCFDNYVGHVIGLGSGFLYQQDSSPNVTFLNFSCSY